MTSFFFFFSLFFFFFNFFFFFYTFHLNLVSENCHLPEPAGSCPRFLVLGAVSGSWSGMGWGTSQCFGPHSLSLLLLELLKHGLSDSTKEGQWWRGSFPPLYTLRRVFPVMGSTSVSHHPIPAPGKGRFVSIWIPKGPHPSPGILFLAFLGTSSLSWHLFPGISMGCIPFMTFFWHSQGLHPSLGISMGCILS